MFRELQAPKSTPIGVHVVLKLVDFLWRFCHLSQLAFRPNSIVINCASFWVSGLLVLADLAGVTSAVVQSFAKFRRQIHARAVEFAVSESGIEPVGSNVVCVFCTAPTVALAPVPVHGIARQFPSRRNHVRPWDSQVPASVSRCVHVAPTQPGSFKPLLLL